VHYVPQPMLPQTVATKFQARSFQDPGLRTALDHALPGRSSSWPRQSWDRADLLFAMLYFNDAIAQARAAVDAASAARRTARELPNPTVALASEYANQHDGSPLWLWGVATEWLLDFGTRRGARIDIADLAARQAGFDFAELAWRTRETLRRSLSAALLADREVALLESVHADRDSQLAMARRQLELGASARGDLDRLVGDALSDEQKLSDARRRASAARSALASAIGIPVHTLDALRLSWPGLEDPPAIPADRLQQWRGQALLERADVRSAVIGYSQAEQALRQEVIRQYPDVRVGPGYTWDHGVKRLQLNLSLTLPLLNRNQGAIAEAQARRVEAGANLEATVARAFSEIDAGIRQWQLARAHLVQSRGATLQTAQRMYSQVEAGFAAGANDRTQLVAAHIARTLAQLQVLDAVGTTQDALADLEDSLRRPLEGPELEFNPAALQPQEGRR